eukprot:GFUD01003952.1.p1 GENE.GFUD01003952.1~~GFUD01003952.1.p1  ORF type:complete len:406 (+),score=125.46 GFUD01003952.1:100-1317(+)
MYRREYPDVPGLFDARFSQYNQPSLGRELQRTWLISIIGMVMVLVGGGLLFWNEGRAVRTSVALAEGLRDVLIPETLDVVFEENNGALVLVGGALTIEDSLTDEFYGISVPAVKMRKVVQVYQWYETEDAHNQNIDTGDHDTHVEKSYSYDTDWFDQHIDSSNFANTLGHHNPHLDSWPANSSLLTNSRVKIGGFLLGTDAKEKFSEFKPFTSDSRPHSAGVKIYAGLYYHCRNVWEPEVGEHRVQFSYAGRHGDQFTVVGRQAGREVRPYQTEAGEELLLLQAGLKEAGEVFHAEQISNRTATWVYRLAGWFVAFLGLSCLSSLLEMMMDQYPIMRRMVALGVTSLHFSVSITLSLSIIGLGWLWYRPLLGLALLLTGLLPHSVPVVRIMWGDRGRWHGDRDRP